MSNLKKKRVKDLTRRQLEQLLRVNMPHLGFNKRTSLQSLRDKLNILGGNYSTIVFNNKWEIKY